MKKGTLIIILCCLCFAGVMLYLYFDRATPIGYLTITTSGSLDHEPTDPSAKNVFIDNKIDINAAGLEELTLLPNIGETFATRIITYRETHGYYKSVDDLLNVDGIGQTRLEQIRKFITVGGQS